MYFFVDFRPREGRVLAFPPQVDRIPTAVSITATRDSSSRPHELTAGTSHRMTIAWGKCIHGYLSGAGSTAEAHVDMSSSCVGVVGADICSETRPTAHLTPIGAPLSSLSSTRRLFSTHDTRWVQSSARAGQFHAWICRVGVSGLSTTSRAGGSTPEPAWSLAGRSASRRRRRGARVGFVSS